MSHDRRPDPLLLGLLAAASLASVVPLWIVEFLPLLDIPQHLMTISVMHRLEEPAFAAFYAFEPGSTQYLLYYLTCDLLANLVGVESANRLFLSLYLASVPWAVWYFLRAHGRIEAAALLSVPLAFNTFFFMGLVNYVFAIPLFFWGLGLQKRALDAPHSSRSRQAWLLVASLLVFYSHLQIFLIYIGAMGLFGLFAWRGPRRFVTSNLHLVPSLLLFGWWGLASDGLAGGEAWQQAVSRRYASLTGASWESLYSTLKDLPDRLLHSYRSPLDESVLVAVGLGILVLLLLRQARWRDSAPEVLTLFVVAFYLFLPTNYKWIWPVNWRFAPVAALLFLAWGRADLGLWARRGLTLAFASVAGFAIWMHVQQFRAFDAEAATFTPVLESIEPGSRVMSLVFDSGSRVIEGAAYLHFVQYPVVRAGGVGAYSFAEAPQSPVRFVPPHQGGPPPTPLRSEWKPHEFRFHAGGRYYDYFLVRGGPKTWQRRAQVPRGALEPVAHSGPWRLYRHVRDRAGTADPAD